MSYHISYGSDKDLIRFRKRNHHGIILFAFAAALIVGIRVFLPDVFHGFLDVLNPMDEYGVQAFHAMIDHVQQGTPVGEAVDAFCRSIIDHASIWY